MQEVYKIYANAFATKIKGFLIVNDLNRFICCILKIVQRRARYLMLIAYVSFTDQIISRRE